MVARESKTRYHHRPHDPIKHKTETSSTATMHKSHDTAARLLDWVTLVVTNSKMCAIEAELSPAPTEG